MAEENELNDGESMTCESAEGRHDSDRSLSYLIALAVGLSGLQGVFAVQFSHGSPYLLSLGLSKPLMALAWVAGPLAGAIVQPYVGSCSDQSGHWWGRRRPYIAAGGIAAIVSLLGLAWVEEIVDVILQPLAAGSKLITTATNVLAIAFIYSLNTAVQPIQGGLRALIAEHCPKHQQSEANAWAGRLIEIGNIVIYLSAYIPLQRFFPFVTNAQFKILSVIVSVGLIITLSTTCLVIVERRSREGEISTKTNGILERISSIKDSVTEIPPEIWGLCRIQFFSWMGWFPFLYYITSYISQIYIDQSPYLDQTSSGAKHNGSDATSDAAAVGSLALLLHATISLFTGFVVPTIVQQTTTHSFPMRISSINNRRNKNSEFHWLTLKHAWLVSHVFFALCILGISILHSLTGVILVVGFMGINRAITAWAPYALLAVELSCGDDGESLPGSSKARAGVILGVYNMAIALPQILSALACSLIFWFTRTGQVDGINGGLEWILRLSALPAIVAAFLTLRLRRDTAVSGYTSMSSFRANERALSLQIEC